jgi:hypothetical protein
MPTFLSVIRRLRLLRDSLDSHRIANEEISCTPPQSPLYVSKKQPSIYVDRVHSL